MGLNRRTPNLNYLEEDTGVNTRINIFGYKRRRPNETVKREEKCFITLPLPLSMPSDQYSMSIRDVDLDTMGNFLGFNSGTENQKMFETIAERLGTDKNVPVAAYTSAFLATAPLVADLLSQKSIIPLAISETLQAATGVVRNPHTALLFQNVQLRTFTFNWQLSPRSEQQSRNLDTIIRTIKGAMHPNIAFNGFALDYPDLFTVNFNNNKEGVVNVDLSFLQDFTVNPTPNGHAYYKNGYPVAVEMSMTFKEIAIKTAEDYGQTPDTNDRLGFADPGARK